MNSKEYYHCVENCRVCGSENLRNVLEIEPQYIASTFVKTNKDNPLSAIKIPMTLLLCDKCGLCQLKETVKPDVLYTNYFYRSSVSDTMRKDLRDLVQDVSSRVQWKPGDPVLDIGCNDGMMLSAFPKEFNRVGIDPAQNIDRSHLDPTITIVKDYFPSGKLHKYKFKIITSTAMFYDLDNPNEAVRELKRLLDKDGVVCIQVSYLYSTIKDLNFYDICHEHLEYYSLRSLAYLMERNGMAIFDASTNGVNGGSLRILVAHEEAKRPKSENLEFLLLQEQMLRLESPDTFDTFSKLIKYSIRQVKGFIESLSRDGKSVIALGASTKGNVLLQICGLDKKLISYISERNPFKVGLRTMGTDMELISEEAARAMKPDCMFVIPWNFKAEILAREKDYLDQGGKLLFIMPYPYIVDKNGESKISMNSFIAWEEKNKPSRSTVGAPAATGVGSI